MPLFSGSGAVKIMDLYEDEPNDDYESWVISKRIVLLSGQKKVPKIGPGPALA